MSGPGFRSVHLALDDVVASAQSAADAIAERARALGLAVDGSPAAVAAAAYAPALPVPTTVAQTVRWATARIEAVTAGVRAAVEEVAEVDPPTGDLLNAIVLDLDKQRWLLRSEASDPAT